MVSFNALLRKYISFIGLLFFVAAGQSQNLVVDVNVSNYTGDGFVAMYYSGDKEWHFEPSTNGVATFTFIDGCITTDVASLKSETDFKIYPNPVANGQAFLEFSQNITDQTIVTFSNIEGKILGTADLSRINEIVLEKSKGIVFYQVTQSDKVLSNGTIINYADQLSISAIAGNTNTSSLKAAAQIAAPQDIIISFKHPEFADWERIGDFTVDCGSANAIDINVQVPMPDTIQRIELPVEVFGSNGHIEAVEFELGSNWQNAGHMWFKVHNVQQNGKMQFRLNGGTWYNISNSSNNLTMDSKAKSYGGFGGGFSTIEFSYDVNNSDFIEGTNVLEFKFTTTYDPAVGIPMSTGYRVLEFNARASANGQNMLAESSFEEVDPQTWEPPINIQADIDQGENLWLNANLKDGNGNNINAKCADCHAVDGRDLKYFNFSNKSIITRAQFHGLTEGQGKRIASYIRTLNMSYVEKGRPWNPPFQPGPGTDARSAYEWAAGAGLEAVLENDGDMVAQMFGSASPTRGQVDQVTSMQADLNLREIGIAIQFPDWLNWLPKTHPKDLWGENTWNNSRAQQGYVNLTSRFINQNAAGNLNLINWVEDFHVDVREYVHEGGELYYWVNKSGTNLDIAKNRGYSAEFIKFSVSLWQGVKLFELMNKFGGQAQAKRIRSAAEKWQWPSNYFSVFQAAAHFTGDLRGTSAFQWQSLTTGIYFSTAWYELQMVLAPGMRSGYIVEPVDWAYNHQHVYKLSDISGILEPMRLHRNLLKNWQQRDRNIKIRADVWSMREVSPWRLFSDHKGDQYLVNRLNNYSQGLRGKLLSSMVSAWKRKVDRSYPATEDWPRKDNPQFGSTHWYQIEPTDFRPAFERNPLRNGVEPFIAPGMGSDAVEAIALYRCLTDPRFDNAGLDFNARQDLESWCETHFDVTF